MTTDDAGATRAGRFRNNACYAQPDTVAEAILYFLGGADVVTGETLILDGGHHLNQMPFARR